MDDHGLLTPAENEQLARNGRLLSDLYKRSAPLHAASGEDWETHALAYLARAHYTLETILTLPDRWVDMSALARCLYEHVVAFAWLLIDPEAHRPKLLRFEYDERMKMLRDTAGWQQLPPPDPNVVALALVGMADASAPATPDRALAADKHWSSSNTKWLWHFRHCYVGLFRGYGVFVHPMIAGLDAFIVPSERGAAVCTPAADPMRAPTTDAVMCFADALVVSSQRLGWPYLGEVLKAFTFGLVDGDADGQGA